MGRLTLVYNPVEGDVVPDGLVNEYVKAKCDTEGDHTVYIASAELIRKFRLAIAQGWISYRDLRLQVRDKFTDFDNRAMMVNPEISPETVANDLGRLMRYRIDQAGDEW